MCSEYLCEEKAGIALEPVGVEPADKLTCGLVELGELAFGEVGEETSKAGADAFLDVDQMRSACRRYRDELGALIGCAGGELDEACGFELGDGLSDGGLAHFDGLRDVGNAGAFTQVGPRDVVQNAELRRGEPVGLKQSRHPRTEQLTEDGERAGAGLDIGYHGMLLTCIPENVNTFQGM